VIEPLSAGSWLASVLVGFSLTMAAAYWLLAPRPDRD
jgi:hypothetical protein